MGHSARTVRFPAHFQRIKLLTKKEVGQTGFTQNAAQLQEKFRRLVKNKHAKLPGRAPGILHGRRLAASPKEMLPADTITRSACNPWGRSMRIEES